MTTTIDESREWIEADGLGGFAMGTASGVRTRRYHAILCASRRPPVDRVALVKGFDAWIETPEGTWGLSAQRYADGHLAPDGPSHLASFSAHPWPTWTYRLPSGLVVTHELVAERNAPRVALTWRVEGPRDGVRLIVRPLLACHDMHALHHERSDWRSDAHQRADGATWWRPYDTLPAVLARADGPYTHDPTWYRGVLYVEERDRGFDALEDLGSPGVFRFNLDDGRAALVLEATDSPESLPPRAEPARSVADRVRARERDRRDALGAPLARAADAYIVARGEGRTIIAGYPWFGDWGRDTFIAMRGLCLATGRLDDARSILLQWAAAVSDGMLPNRFVDRGDAPEFNSVDGSLWYVVAAQEYLDAAGPAAAREHHAIHDAILAIVGGHARGTRYGIRADADGLLAAGEHGQQLTWMDARAAGREVTPRIGKPVEVQALWASALDAAARLHSRWAQPRDRAIASFRARFWNADRSCLYDVVDTDHAPGAVDAAVRPNQVLAVGGLPISLLEPARARAVVDTVERLLLTPLGLRSLERADPDYLPRYEGGPDQRDASYHQGTVWPWLMGPFVEAWVRVRGSSAESARAARERFVMPLVRHLDEGGLGHTSEIFDADPPRLPRGCPFQAWSVGELIRVDRLLREIESRPASRAPRAQHATAPA